MDYKKPMIAALMFVSVVGCRSEIYRAMPPSFEIYIQERNVPEIEQWDRDLKRKKELDRKLKEIERNDNPCYTTKKEVVV